MDTADDEKQMEIVNENESGEKGGNEVEQKIEGDVKKDKIQEKDKNMDVEDKPNEEEDDGTMKEEEDDEKTKEEDDEKTKEEDEDGTMKEEEEDDDDIKNILNEEDIELFEADLDLESLEGQDPAEIEKKKQELLEKRDKLIAYLESKGADPEELLNLGLEDQASTPTPPSSSRQKRKRTSTRRYSETPSSSYSLRDKTKRSKPIRKTPKKESIDVVPEDTKTSPSDNRRERTTWTLSENKQLLKILESGNTDIQHIYKEMSKLPGRRKSIGHIRNKKSNLLQKAALKGTTMVDILREDILKTEEAEGKIRRQSDTYVNDTITNAPISNAEFNELKNLLISGLLENQRQIALLRREFAHYRGLPTPPDVAEILSDEEDDILHEQQQSRSTTPNSSKKTLVIKKTTKQTTTEKPESEQTTTE